MQPVRRNNASRQGGRLGVAGLPWLRSNRCSGDDLGKPLEGALGVDVDRAAVDGVRLAVAGVDAVVPRAAGQDVLAGAAGDLVVAVEAGVGAAGGHIVE